MAAWACRAVQGVLGWGMCLFAWPAALHAQTMADASAPTGAQGTAPTLAVPMVALAALPGDGPWRAGLGLAPRGHTAALAPLPTAGPAAPEAPAVVLGISRSLGDWGPGQAHLGWQTPIYDGDRTGDGSRQVGMSLSFSNRDPYADLRRGRLLTVALSGQTALSLRPRGGRLGLQLNSRW